MRHTVRPIVPAALLLATLACSSHPRPVAPPPVMIPPQIDLKDREVIGVIDFDSAGRGSLGPMATRKFTDLARRDQGLVRFVSLGPTAEVLRAIGRTTLDQAALMEIGKQRHVQTIVMGTVKMSNVKPNLRVASDLKAAGMNAQVRATLDVQMVEAATGASLWNASTSATESLGDVAVVGGSGLTLGHDDPDRAYGNLVDNLVEQATRPFRASWERR